MATKKFGCDIETGKVTGLNPPVDLTDATNKEYVDSLSLGSIQLINGQHQVVFPDTARGKLLSTGLVPFVWSADSVGNNEFISVGNAADTLIGYHAPFDGTVVAATAHCENTKNSTKQLFLYTNAVAANILTLTPGTDVLVTDTSLNMDFNQFDKLRMFGGGGGKIEDTLITVWVRWRATP